MDVNETAPVAPRRLTAGVISGGAAIGAACFGVALAAGLAGVDGDGGDAADVPALLAALAALRPWAWASLGILAVIATPAVGLLVTAAEYASVSDRRTVVLAFAVLGILAASLVAALLT
ncbi:hypothetical protein BH24CHL9_BH24CHL9_03100 [soil metagenome]